MSKITKIWLIVAGSFILIGALIFGGTMSMINWDFLKLNTSKFETNEYIIDEKFKDLSLDIDTAGIDILKSDDDKCKVVCYEEANAKHNVKVESKTLNITLDNQRKWYEYIGFNLDTPKISVYLPKEEYGDLLIKSSTGDITVSENLAFDSIDVSLSTGDVSCLASCENELKIATSTGNIDTKDMSADSISLCASTGKITTDSIKCHDLYIKVSTGKTYLSDVDCDNFTSEGTTGLINLEDVVATGSFNIKRSTGDVSFDACDASQVYIKTSTGSVKGNFLTEKIYIASSSTGDINVPKSTKGGKCEIYTDTGDIQIITTNS